MNNIYSTHCEFHNGRLEMICYCCNELLCSQCSPSHNRHQFDHINNIKKSIKPFGLTDLSCCSVGSSCSGSSMSLNNNNSDGHSNHSSDNNNNPVNMRIDQIWSTINELKDSYKSLEATEDSIGKSFAELHDILKHREHQLKQSVISEKHKVSDSIDKLVNELKQINVIVNNIHGREFVDATSSSHQNHHHHHHLKRLSVSSATSCFEQFDLDEEEEVEELEAKSHHRHFIGNIIESINESKNIDDFVNSNTHSLFSNVCCLPSNTHEQNLQTLQSIQKYFHDYSNNNQGNVTYESYLCKKHFGVAIVNRDFIEDFKLNLGKSIYLEPKTIEHNIVLKRNEPPNPTSFKAISQQQQQQQQQPSQSSQPVVESNQPVQQSLILASDGQKVVSLIDVSNRDNIIIEKMNFQYNSLSIPHSMVAVGEYVYMFGCFIENEFINKYYRFSLKSKSIDFQDNLCLKNKANLLSVCYDGLDHLYLVNNPLEIIKFNIKTQRFSHLFDHDTQTFYGAIACFYYNYHLYILANNKKIIYKISPISRQLCEHIKLDNSSKIGSCCADDNGNIYVTYIGTSIIRFVRINLDSKEITRCTTIKFVFKNYLKMLFNRVSDNESYIYLIGGKEYGNHLYSIENDSWCKLDWNDENDRCYYGSTIINSFK
ncbi:hypothetical protein PPL_05979 [Heterostelium album PN500]|uniref:B box-type domain-containing protein n=1 Tax=Heterostelium pallidum (strain ATCC 26659 / Pp 5 / PN500) TaxID=670386 RepID=D3BBV9_HETP5|nr:hypothetical protein PPL_05979 [Heterostelium album PN500]EFA81142.1 hypothetical protein PPL_05979 [Heterostelium album PN500]|eukprot:XP_020433260.1 hypothetical protein PPL_05979 [Heterostelium album PN500]